MKPTFPMQVLALALSLHAAALSAAPATSRAPAAGAPDLAGKMRRPLQESKQQHKTATVLFFVTTDCPISNRFAPEINRICRDYQARNIAFCIVQTDPYLKASDARQHAKQFGFSAPILLDRKHVLVRLAGAHVTPEAAILSPSGQVLYRGRIDDTYASLSKPRAKPTHRDLRLALDAVCEGKTVAVPRTQALGCYIEGQQ